MDITITIDDSELQRRIKRLLDLTGDLTPAMDEIGQRYDRRVLENFKKEQSPDGKPWKRLSATTLMMGLSRKKGFGKRGLTKRGRTYLTRKQTLVESGELMRRLHYQADRKSMTYGTNGVPYAAIHQFGGKAGRNRKVKIPARPYLAVNRGKRLVLADRDRQMMIEVLERHIEEAAK